MNANPMGIAAYTSQMRTRINEFLRNELKACGYGDLVPSYGTVLSVVYQNGGCVQIKTIYDTLCKQKTTITECINRLVELGYLTKETSPADARCTYVQMTDKAGTFQEDFGRISRKLREKIFKGFSEEEQKMLADLMVRTIENFS
jgi:MarR family transcriptional regulator, organic hydroperoxide resistance regulator